MSFCSCLSYFDLFTVMCMLIVDYWRTSIYTYADIMTGGVTRFIDIQGKQ